MYEFMRCSEVNNGVDAWQVLPCWRHCDTPSLCAELSGRVATEQEWQGPAKCIFLPLSGKLRLESSDAQQQTPPSAKNCERHPPTCHSHLTFSLIFC